MCSPGGAEVSLALSLGVQGDVITHDFTLSLALTFERYGWSTNDISAEEMQRLVLLYADRVAAKITYDAIFEGRDLWLIAAEYRFPYIAPVLKQYEIGTLEKMAIGLIRRDQVCVELHPAAKS